jgi:5'(3')-deoxyribonucleotidase
MVQKILLDTDGVLRDFIGALGTKYNTVFDWSSKKSAIEQAGISSLSLREEMDSFYFWKDMPVTPYAEQILQIVREYFRDEQIWLVSSSYLFPNCVSGCFCWYEKHFPKFLAQGRVILIQDKSLLANINTVLIDDHRKVISNFRKGGGWGVLCPQPWNGQTFSIYHISNQLELVMGGRDAEGRIRSTGAGV